MCYYNLMIFGIASAVSYRTTVTDFQLKREGIMKRLLLIFAVVCICLASCDASDPVTTVTSASAGTSSPICDFLSADNLKDFRVYNRSYYKSASNKLIDSLISIVPGLSLNETHDSSAANRIEIVIEKTMTENTWEVKFSDGVVTLRAFSQAGIDKAIVGFSEALSADTTKEYHTGDVIAEGNYQLADITKMGLEEEEVAYFIGDTEKDPLSYKTGDEIVFHIALYVDNEIVSCPIFKWEAYTDDGKTYSGEESGASGELEVKIPATGTGFVRLKCNVINKRNKLLKTVKQSTETDAPPMFGACINFDEIGKSWREPDDFDEFWSGQLEQLDKVAPDLISINEIKGRSETHDVYVVKVNCSCSNQCEFATGYVTVPKNAEKRSLKLNMYYSGYGAVDSYLTACPLTDPNSIVFSNFAHSMELGHESSYYSSLDNYGFHGNESVETCYFRCMILRDIQALRFAKSYFGSNGVTDSASSQHIDGLDIWDGKSIGVIGGSQGAFRSFAVTALCPEVTTGSYDIPAMCDFGGYEVGCDDMRSVFLPEYTEALSYFDTISFSKRISKTNTAQISAGLGDYVCPPSGIVTLYKNIPCKATLTFTQGRTHGYMPAYGERYTRSK